MIQDNFNAELDELRAIVKGGKEYLSALEQKEQDATGIKKLKIGYNRVFGYYYEVSNSFKALVPDTYIRKQTLTNCERYITEELKELESKVLGAQYAKKSPPSMTVPAARRAPLPRLTRFAPLQMSRSPITIPAPKSTIRG